MNIDAMLEELGETLERSVAAAQRPGPHAVLDTAARVRDGRLRHPRILAGGSLGLAGIGTALLLALSAGGVSAPPAFAISQRSADTVLVQFNWQSGSPSLVDVDRALSARYHESINVTEAAGPATVPGPITCTPGPEPVAGTPDPSTTPPASAPTIMVELGSHGTGWGYLPHAGNTGVRRVAHLTSCSAWSTR